MSEDFKKSNKTVYRFSLAFALVWTLVFLMSIIFFSVDIHVKAKNQAFVSAQSIVERDMLYRKWLSGFDGLYLKENQATHADSLPSFVHDQDVETVDGQRLVMISPTSITRLVYDFSNRQSGMISKITSLDLINPDNAPDSWEKAALSQMGKGRNERFSELVSKNGIQYARTLVPLMFGESCQECHTDLGSRAGDFRGGISVQVPFEPFLDREWKQSVPVIMMALILWVIGLAVIFFFSHKLRQQVSLIDENERQLNIAETSLHYLSHFDQKTNLPNRALFDDRLIQAIAHANRLGNKVAIAVMQVANFNQICDTYSESVSDSLIRRCAETVAGCIRPDDTIARFGRESLLILLPNIKVRENIARVIDKVNSAFEESIEIGDREAFVNASFGVALYPEDSKDPGSLVKYAETAASRAGSLERSNLQMYSTELNDMAQEQLFLETGLRKAVKENQFSVFYQPQIDAPSGKIVGAEALIRWFHPEKGMVAPDQFIPLAENNGTIFQIGEWVMREACKQAVEWQKAYDRPFQVGVNVSAKQFQDPKLVDMIENVLAETGLAPGSLEIEITEGMIMSNVENAVDTLVDLKIRGINIAIDDFGTGYSSLSHLKRFPIDRLKIDRSFVSEIDTKVDDQVIVEMIIGLTGKLNLSVIAEGVEKKEHRDFLVSRGCYSMQGYYFGKPVAADIFDNFLASST